MERLTMTPPDGGTALTFDLDITCEKSEIMKLLKVFERLKEYEDLEEQGLLLKLPCKVGDTAYVVGTKCLAEEEPVEWCNSHKCDECIYDETYTVFEIEVDEIMMYNFLVGDNKNFILNKSVFLTKEEAEKALERLEKENE